MADVRMKGFRERADLRTVQAWLDQLPLARTVEDVALDAGGGRVLATSLTSHVDVPAFRRSAMDGWAVRGEDTFGASADHPLELAEIGVSMPGHRFDGEVGARQAVRIMTGAPVPEGADAVLRAEGRKPRWQHRARPARASRPGRTWRRSARTSRRAATSCRQVAGFGRRTWVSPPRSAVASSACSRVRACISS